MKRELNDVTYGVGTNSYLYIVRNMDVSSRTMRPHVNARAVGDTSKQD
jgi:hypothetical protein